MEGRISRTELAYENWQSKYQYESETEIGTQMRVAYSVAEAEKEPKKWADEFLHTLVKFDDSGNPLGYKCTFGGRITANLGTSYKKATPWNCFINGPVSGAKISYTRGNDFIEYPVVMKTAEDPDDLGNIFLTILEQAKTLASEGGYGINFDFIRPRGTLIKGTGIKHPGVIAYMKIWDSVAECIVKGDNDGYKDLIKNHLDDEESDELKEAVKKMNRKGAMLSKLSDWHPDIEEYVRAKQESAVLTKFNMSVGITDGFMQAVDNNDFYDLKFKGKVRKRIKAKDLYDLIMTSNYNRGEPGVLFMDNMMKNNPVAYLGRVTASNPCFHPDTLVSTVNEIGRASCRERV